MHQISISYDAKIYFSNLLPVLRSLLIVLFCILLQKGSLIWITFCGKLRLGRSRRAISSLFYLFILIYYLRWCSSLILLSGDIKTNPGPSSWQCFSVCHWNLDSITAQNFAKLSLLTAYNLVPSFDINFEVSITSKICRFIHLYRSPSQKQDGFQEFRSNLEMNLDALSTNNPFLTVVIGDFNAITWLVLRIHKLSFLLLNLL